MRQHMYWCVALFHCVRLLRMGTFACAHARAHPEIRPRAGSGSVVPCFPCSCMLRMNTLIADHIFPALTPRPPSLPQLAPMCVPDFPSCTIFHPPWLSVSLPPPLPPPEQGFLLQHGSASATIHLLRDSHPDPCSGGARGGAPEGTL